jgi:hypothetical protein
VLLVDKVANRVVRQSAEEVQNSFALPVSVLQQYSPSVQVHVRFSFKLCVMSSDYIIRFLLKLYESAKDLLTEL